jgi:hypothetical protein
MARAVLLALERRRWACKAALPLVVLLARATRPQWVGVLGGVLRVCGVPAYVGFLYYKSHLGRARLRALFEI